MSNGDGQEQDPQGPGLSPRVARILQNEGLLPDTSMMSPRVRRIMQEQGMVPRTAESAEDRGIVEATGHLFEAFGRALHPENLRFTLGALPGVTETQAFVEELLTGSTERTDPLFGRRAAISAGISQSLTSAGLNLAELGGEAAAEVGAEGVATKIFDFTEARREDVGDFNQSLINEAMSLGASREAVEDAALTGNFVGFLGPLGVSIRTARAIPGLDFGRGPVGIFLRDFEIGAITGLLFSEGDIKDRTLGAAREGAYFGAFGLALSAPLRFFKTFRNNRAITKSQMEDVQEQIEAISERFDPETGRMMPQGLSGTQGRTVMEVLSEESNIAQSQRAQELLRNNADVEAIVQGIREGSEAGVTHTVIRGVENLEDVVPRLQREFPGLTVQNVRRGGGFDLAVGPRGLNNQQLSQFKNEGRFEGQRIKKNGVEYEYVRLSDDGESVVARRLDSGNTVTLKNEAITDLPQGAPPAERTPQLEALTQEFEEFFLTRLNRVSQQREDLSPAAVARALREGRIEAADFMKRDWTAGGAGLFPEELGGGPGGGRGFRVQITEAGDSPEVLRQFEGTGVEPLAFRVLDPDGQPVGALTALKEGQTLRVQNFEAEGLGVGGVRDVFRSIMDQFPDIKTVAGERVRDEGPELVEHSMDRLIGRSEGELGGKLAPENPVAFEDMAEFFLRERGLLEAEDAAAFSDFAAQSLRRRLWNEIPKQDRQILGDLRKEMESIFEGAKPSLERHASTLGFSVNRLDDGRVVLRDVNTGAPLEFQNVDAAREALQGAQRNFQELGERLIPELGGGFSPEATRGLELPDGPIFRVDDLDPTKATDIIPRPVTATIDTALQRFEEATGIPLWSRVIEPLDRGAQLANANMSRKWLPSIHGNFKGLSRSERIEITDFIRSIEGEEIGRSERVSQMKSRGFSKAQIESAEGMRDMFNLGADEFGVPLEDFIVNYYTRVVPFVERHGVAAPNKIYPEGIPRSMEPWFRNQRTGEMGVIEKDPMVVMMKWFRAAEFERHMGQRWRDAYRMVREDNPFGLNDLPRDQRAEVLQLMGGREGVKVFRQTVENTLANLRGFPTRSKDTTRRLSRRIMDRLNITTNERVLEDFAHTALTTLYGSTLAARPRFVTRNFIQNLWFLYPRLGGKHSGPALERALTPEGYREALSAGAVRSREGGVFLGGELFNDVLESMPIRGKGPIGMPIAGAIRGGLRVGRKIRQISRRGLVNVSTSDDLNRVWAFHWQKMHTREQLRRFREGEMSEAQFFDEALPGYSQTVKEAFAERLRLSDEEALNFAAKRAADENHFIYNLWSAPPWMQKSMGRLAGMFGRWPLGALEAYRNMVRYMTPAQKARAGARIGAMTGAVTITGAELGIDLWNWIAPMSPLTYAGGPVLDFAFDAKELVENWQRDPARAQGAWNRLVNDVGRVSLPGSQFYRDFTQSLREGGRPQDKYLLMMLGRPDGEENFFSEFQLNPDLPQTDPGILQDPERRRAFDDSLRGRSPSGVLRSGEAARLLSPSDER